MPRAGPCLLRGRAASRAALPAAAVAGLVISLMAQYTIAAPSHAMPAPDSPVVHLPAAKVVAAKVVAAKVVAAKVVAAKVSAAEVPAVTAARAVSGPTTWRALNKAIASIPRYRKGIATWVAGNPYGHYGTTNLNTRRIYVSRSVPASRLFSVAAHEYAHVLTVVNYAGSLRRLDKGLTKYFHAGTTLNREYAADCMARLLGASWVHYTWCGDRRWRAAAATLLRGRRL